MTEHVRECPKCGYTGVHNCGCEHVCEWRAWAQIGTSAIAYVGCECGERLRTTEIEARLNEYEKLKRATDRLNWLTALNAANELNIQGWTETPKALRAYADILDEK